jgi:hypothetical protein
MGNEKIGLSGSQFYTVIESDVKIDALENDKVNSFSLWEES